MKTKVILLVLILLLSASCLCVSTPPPKEMLKKYSPMELTLGFLVVAVMIATPLLAPVLMFPRIL